MTSPDAARPSANAFALAPVRVAPLERRAVLAGLFAGLASFVALGAALFPGLASFVALRGASPEAWLSPFVGVVGLATVALAAGLFVHRWLRDRVAAMAASTHIVVDATALHVPGRSLEQPRQQIPLESIFSIEWTGRGGDDLLIGCSGRVVPLLIRAARLARRADIEALASALRGGIEGLPDGAARLRAIEACAAVARAGERRARATPWIVGALAAIHLAASAVEVLSGPIAHRTLTARLAVDGYGVFVEGEWYRLLSGILLHADLRHLVGNALVLVIFGGQLEALLGRSRFVLLALVCGLWASLASAYVGAPSIGASGAIYGIVALLFYLNVVHRARLPARDRLSPTLWCALGALLLADSTLVPRVDWVAHLAGALAGLAAGPIFVPRLEAVSWRRLGGGAMASAVAGVVVAGLLQPGYPRCDPGRDPTVENNRAWLVAVDPEAPRAELETARTCMLEIAAAYPVDPLRDTLAQLHYRLGELDRAIALERELAPTPIYTSQLARFEWARLQAERARALVPAGPPGRAGPSTAPDAPGGAAPSAPGPSVAPEPSAPPEPPGVDGRSVAPSAVASVAVELLERDGAPRVRLRLVASETPRSIDVIASRTDALIGLLRFYVPGEPGAAGAPREIVQVAPAGLADADLTVVHVGDRAGSPLPIVLLAFWPLDPEVAALP